MKNIKSITIVFENLEFVKIPIMYVANIAIGNITKCIGRIAINSAAEYYTSDYVAISLFNQINELEELNLYDSEISVVDRINNHNDITYLEIEFESGDMETVYVDWGDDEYSNEYQKSKKTNKVLLIVIAKDKSIEDCFDEDNSTFEFDFYKKFN